MPEEALDGDTDERSRDERESEGSEGQSHVTRKKNSDSEVETSNENLKNLRVKYELVDFEVKEEDEDHDVDDDDYSEGEDSWLNKVQKKRDEEEKDFVWIKEIEKETYLQVMAPMYLLLEVKSAAPLQVQQVRQAVTHLSRVWPWFGVSIRHRGQERTPWLCVAPTQRPTLQVTCADDDEDEDELWYLVDQQQWRHTSLAEGLLSCVTLITHPRLSAATAVFASVPHAHTHTHTHTNQSRVPTAADDTGSGGVSASTSASTSTSASASTSASTSTSTSASASASFPTTHGTTTCSSQVEVTEVPDLPHKAYLMLGVPRPFVDDTTAKVIGHTLVTLLDDVLAGRIQEEYQPAQQSGSVGKDVPEAGSTGLESWLAEKLQVVLEAKVEGGESNADPESGYHQDEENENESETRGYVQRTIDSITSRNFINRCKAERVSYVNGFVTCVSAAAAAFLVGGEQGRQVETRQRVCEHLHWPAPPLDWHDGDTDEESPSEPSSRPPGVIITAPTGDDDSVFWETVRNVTQQRWGVPAGGKKAMHIFHGLSSEESEDDMPLQRYPMVNLRLCDIQNEKGDAPHVQQVGGVVGVGPHSLSPMRHFLITHTVDLHVDESSQVLSFSLRHSTIFLSPGTGRRFADEIETALKNSLRRR